MTQDASIHHLAEEGRVRDEFGQQVRDILLPVGQEGSSSRAPAPNVITTTLRPVARPPRAWLSR
jgi:hypothetical protein